MQVCCGFRAWSGVGAVLLVLLLGAPAGAAGPATERVSVTSAERSGSGPSPASEYLGASSSRDGRFVVFESAAPNLVPGDTNGVQDVFVRDRVAGTTERVRITGPGRPGDHGSSSGSISDDGRFVAFFSVSDRPADRGLYMFVLDRRTGTTTAVPSTLPSSVGSISGNGRYLVFWEYDAYRYDRVTGRVELVTARLDGSLSRDDLADVTITPDGRYVGFASCASGLVAGDTNGDNCDAGGVFDTFVRDVRLGTTTRVSTTADGRQLSSNTRLQSISADGRLVLFQAGQDLGGRGVPLAVGEYVRDVQTGALRRVSDGAVSLSRDGRLLALTSSREDLVPGDTNRWPDAFVQDWRSGRTVRVSVGSDGRQANGPSRVLGLSPDGSTALFASHADNLAPGDGNHVEDVFARDLP